MKPNLLKLSSASALALALAFAFSPAYAVSVRWPAENIEIDVQFDVQKHTLSGLARLTIPAKGLKSAGFLLNKKFTVESAAIGGEALVLTRVEDFDTTEVTSVYGLYGRWNPSDAAFYVGKLSKNQLKVKTPVILEVRYTGELHVPPDKRQFSRDRIAFEVNGAIGIEGIYLSGGAFWYPLLPDCPTPYSLTARLPKGWQCVTDGVGSVTKQTPEYDQITYISQIPTTGLNFAAGPFQVSSVQLDKITIQAYFLPAEADLAPG
ncbi:MAG: M1 family metallopeptidase, partial [Calditrichaeota bacterium]|nr:M1 family metallopeptidase [Calditrichota bacterium]